jgi:hypothetical protein
MTGTRLFHAAGGEQNGTPRRGAKALHGGLHGVFGVRNDSSLGFSERGNGWLQSPRYQMDRHALALLIPILALAIPVTAIVFGGLFKLARLRLEETRIRAGALPGGAEAELAALRDEVEGLRQELGEVQERVDFAERLLTRSGEVERLPRPGQ